MVISKDIAALARRRWCNPLRYVRLGYTGGTVTRLGAQRGLVFRHCAIVGQLCGLATPG